MTALALFATNAFPDTPIPFPLSTLNLPIVGSIAERLLFSRWSLVMVRQGVGRPKVELDLHRYVGDTTQRRTAEVIPGARFRLYEGAGHFLPEERPKELAADLLELVARAEVR